MPFLILVLTAVGGAIWWWVRRNPRQALDTASDVATTVRNAPRRFAFKNATNTHPVEGIDDPRVAVIAIAQAFIELDDLPTQDQRSALHMAAIEKLGFDQAEASELEVFGRWMIGQCNGAAQALPRVARHLRKIEGDASWETLGDILMRLVDGELTPAQVGALEDLRVIFRK